MELQEHNRSQQIFQAERARYIGEHIEVAPPEAAAMTVEAGIIGPLIEYGEALGLSAEDTDTILKFATGASELARQREQEALNKNPLAQLDLRLTQQINEIRLSDNDIKIIEKDVWRVTLAREVLRKVQINIKDEVGKIHDRNVQNGEDIPLETVLEQFVDSLKPKENTNGFLYTEIAGGRQEDSYNTLYAFGIKNVREFFHKHKPEDSYPVEVKNIPTGIDGVLGHMPDLSVQYGYSYFHYGLIFDKEAIKAIAQSPDLPPLV